MLSPPFPSPSWPPAHDQALADAATPPFRCDVSHDGDVVTVTPVGELDMATAPELDARLREVSGAGFAQLVVDLRGLTFIDSSGIHLLLRWRAATESGAQSFRALPGSERIQAVFAMAGVGEALGFAEG